MAGATTEVAILLSARDEASRQIAALQKQMQELGSSAGGIGRQLSSFGESFRAGIGIGAGFTAIQAGIQAIGTAMSSVGEAAIGMNSRLEQARIGFTSMLGSAETANAFLRDLQVFAAQTPFEFPELVTAAQRMLAYGFAAKEVKPLLTAVGSAAAAIGGGSAAVDSITRALGQMRAATVVQLGELNQLTEQGVPAFEILAQATGKSTAEVKKLVEQGKIASDVFIDAFQEWAQANFGDMMAQQARTFSGAMSTIKDVLSATTADAFRPFFDALSAGAVQLSEFLQGDNFQTWANAFRVAMEGAIGWLGEFFSVLEPLGQAIATAFDQFTSGDFAAAFQTLGAAIDTALGNAVASIQAWAAGMFAAGQNLISELSGGILDGAGSVLMSAVNTVAEIIASFLIGNSPPPEGPLAAIREGGANVINAWGEGAASAASSAVRPAVDAVAGELDRLKDAGKGADEAIRDIGRSIQSIESDARGLKNQIEDITDSYRAQLDPLEEQLDALTKVKDLEAERQKLNFDLEEAQLRQAEIAALGDPVRRRELQDRLATLKARQDEIKTARELADAEKASRGSEKERLKDQLEAQRMAREEAEIREKMKSAKGDEKARLAERLKELQLRRQIAAADDRERAEKASRQQEDARLRAEELRTKQELEGLADKQALAEVKRQKEELKGREEAFNLQQQQQRLEREIAAAPIRAEIERIKKEQEATLKPLKEQLESLSRQKEQLNEQRQAWQGIKSDIGAATGALKAQAKAAAEASRAAVQAPKDKSYTPDALAEAAVQRARENGQRLAQNLRDAFANFLTQNPLSEALQRGLSLAGVGGIVTGVLQRVSEAVPRIAAALLKWREEFIGWVERAWPVMLARLQQLVSGVLSWITANAPLIGERLYLWALEYINFLATANMGMLDRAAELLASLLAWIGQAHIQIAGKLVEWATAFVAWVRPRIPVLLAALGALVAAVVEWIGRNAGRLLDGLAEWGKAFVEWVGPKIPPLLVELGLLLQEMGAWLIDTALPAIVEQLAEWGAAFVDWVEPRIEALLDELWKLLDAMAAWIIDSGLPILQAYLFEWGQAFIDWIADAAPVTLAYLQKLLLDVATWILDGIPILNATLALWASEFYLWVLTALQQLLPQLAFLLGQMTRWIVQDAPPLIMESLKLWTQEFIDWILPAQVGQERGLIEMMLALSKLLLDFTKTLGYLLAGGWALEFIKWARELWRMIQPYLDTFKSNLESWIRSLTNVFTRLVTDLGRLGREAIDAFIRGFTSRSVPSPSLNGFPGRAAGGPVSAGQPYIVGERGPELFLPRQSGSIVPTEDVSRLLRASRDYGAPAAAALGGDTYNFYGVVPETVIDRVERERWRTASLRGLR